MKTTMKGVLLGLLLSALTGTVQGASPPGEMSFQGVLRDSSDEPLDGSYDMVFRFFDGEGGGADEILLDEQLAGGSGAVAVSAGLFQVSLGGGVVMDGSGPGTYGSLQEVFRDYSEVWLQVEIDGGGGFEILDPRIRIHSAPYAANSRYLDGADLSCPAGMSRFWTKCISFAQPAASMPTAVGNCGTNFGGYVCTYMDFVQACGLGVITQLAGGSVISWTGDHVTAAGGNGDDEYLTLNVATCGTNMDGPPLDGALTSLPYRCCR